MKFVILFFALSAAALAFPYNNNTNAENVTAVPTFVAVSDNDVNLNNDNDNLEYEYTWDDTGNRHHNERRSLVDPKSANKAINAGAGFISYAGKKMFGGKLILFSANLSKNFIRNLVNLLENDF